MEEQEEVCQWVAGRGLGRLTLVFDGRWLLAQFPQTFNFSAEKSLQKYGKAVGAGR